VKVSYRTSFVQDLKSIKNKKLLERIERQIVAVESAKSLDQVSAVKKLGGWPNCYRMRVGQYRLGFVIVKDEVEFVRCLPRRDLYRYFP
jgi:mRNA interferase RelE/StbE